MDQNVYVKRYTEKMTSYYRRLGEDPEKFQKGLLAGTLAMMRNRTDLLNEEIFWECFEAEAGCRVRREKEAFVKFYAEVHPTLCLAVRQGRDSRRPLKILREKGYRLVLSTNPVFPRMATYQRMSWAGLVPEDFEYVTTWENSRRCKPNPEYFTELMDRLSLDPADCLVVGNDTRDDMAAGTAAGMSTYLITDFLIDRDGSAGKYQSGTFEEFVRFAEDLPQAGESGRRREVSGL